MQRTHYCGEGGRFCLLPRLRSCPRLVLLRTANGRWSDCSTKSRIRAECSRACSSNSTGSTSSRCNSNRCNSRCRRATVLIKAHKAATRTTTAVAMVFPTHSNNSNETAYSASRHSDSNSQSNRLPSPVCSGVVNKPRRPHREGL